MKRKILLAILSLTLPSAMFAQYYSTIDYYTPSSSVPDLVDDKAIIRNVDDNIAITYHIEPSSTGYNSVFTIYPMIIPYTQSPSPAGPFIVARQMSFPLECCNVNDMYTYKDYVFFCGRGNLNPTGDTCGVIGFIDLGSPTLTFVLKDVKEARDFTHICAYTGNMSKAVAVGESSPSEPYPYIIAEFEDVLNYSSLTYSYCVTKDKLFSVHEMSGKVYFVCQVPASHHDFGIIHADALNVVSDPGLANVDAFGLSTDEVNREICVAKMDDNNLALSYIHYENLYLYSYQRIINVAMMHNHTSQRFKVFEKFETVDMAYLKASEKLLLVRPINTEKNSIVALNVLASSNYNAQKADHATMNFTSICQMMNSCFVATSPRWWYFQREGNWVDSFVASCPHEDLCSITVIPDLHALNVYMPLIRGANSSNILAIPVSSSPLFLSTNCMSY